MLFRLWEEYGGGFARTVLFAHPGKHCENERTAEKSKTVPISIAQPNCDGFAGADAVRLHNSREYHLRNGGQRTHNARAIVRAAEQANVHNFVLGLPEDAGGRKRRPIERRPQATYCHRKGTDQRANRSSAGIEATSALDTENEKAINPRGGGRKGRKFLCFKGRQKGIGKCPQGADLSCDCAPIVDHPKFGHNFLVIKDGRVVEQGVHDKLMNRGGIYTTLCETQILKEEATE
ncbi:hypothetical protein niasHT_011511 [Heterodera trifolii]|uniref:Uncharacterized protein n=1 Tax=Heterodera trifolii TaxID=157864 RepID=A0ABD2LF68_9BILA